IPSDNVRPCVARAARSTGCTGYLWRGRGGTLMKMMVGKTSLVSCLAALACLGSWACSSDNAIDAGTTQTIDSATSTIDGASGGQTFTATLKASNETPVCAGAGATAMGTAMATLSSDQKTLTVTFTYSGLSGNATAAHVHFGTTAA